MITTTTGTITPGHISSFRKIVGENFVFADEESLQHYGHDETENLFFPPEVVIKPRTAAEISEILKICNADKIPVTPRGAGTGLSGGALPHLGGVLLSTERMNSILNIDERNLQVTTEPGVITEVLQMAVKEKGLFYPPDPASRTFSWKRCESASSRKAAAGRSTAGSMDPSAMPMSSFESRCLISSSQTRASAAGPVAIDTLRMACDLR